MNLKKLKGRVNTSAELVVDDCLFKHGFQEKGFVNSIGVQTRMLSDVSCLLSQGCQYLTSNVVREAQI